MPDLATPAAPAAPATPAAPSASAPAASTPAPATTAPAAPVTPATPSAPAVVPPAASAPPATPAPYDPKTSTTPPSSADYAQDPEGIAKFVADNTKWSLEHPEEAARLRQQKLAAEDAGTIAEEKPTGTVAEGVAKADGEEKKPDAAAPVVEAPTPAAIEEWTTKSPELKAAFEKSPELKAAVMEMARENEKAKPVLDIVSTPEEATFAVEHANRLVSLQTNWILSAEDPDMVDPAFQQLQEMFVERDAQGAPIKGPDGKPQMAADYAVFERRVGKSMIENLTAQSVGQIEAIKARLAGNYASDELRAADTEALEQAEYAKAAFDFVLARTNEKESGSGVPALPPNATPEQIAYNKKLEEREQAANAKEGKQSTESRKTARQQLNREIQNFYEAGVNTFINTKVAEMKARGEYLPDFVLNDKWINPGTGKTTNLSAFGVKIYLALNDKINKNPIHAAKLSSLEALGASGKDARQAEISRLQNLYLPKIFGAEVKRIQDGIRASSRQDTPNPAAGVGRVEPQSAATVVPSGMNGNQLRKWAEGEAKKDPGFENMSQADRETLIIKLKSRKQFGGQ
jgi:hypothetical protein